MVVLAVVAVTDVDGCSCQVSNVCIVLLFLSLGVAFPILGLKVRRRLSNVPIIKSSRQAKVAEISAVAWILTAVFLLRSILILVLPNSLQNFFWTEDMVDDYFWLYCVLVLVYYTIFEAFPGVTVLWYQRCAALSCLVFLFTLMRGPKCSGTKPIC